MVSLDPRTGCGHDVAMAPELSTSAATVLSLLVLAAFALVAGGVMMIRRGDRQKGVLMIACAVVALGNVMIWTV
ncbi:MAG: hypothetical protein CVT77_18970 [Alphaproteobacteria bacterium HGW-Alphaproteobacteria-16]|nr:MAG: hypothetical protein CVT77_18970 [Alphaproteobacteria bacterium HGW-Alphaproteobacteria-16]